MRLSLSADFCAHAYGICDFGRAKEDYFGALGGRLLRRLVPLAVVER